MLRPLASTIFCLVLSASGFAQEPATAPAEPGPRTALKQFATAVQAGDVGGVRSRLEARGPAEAALADAMAQTAAAAAELRKAAEAKFGAAAAGKLAGVAPLSAESQRLEKAVEKIDGDAAVVEIPTGHGAVPIRLVRVEGQWKIPVVDLLGGEDPENVSRLLPTMRGFVRAMQATAGEIAAGRYKSADDASDALRSRMREIASTMPVEVVPKAATRPAGASPTEEPEPATKPGASTRGSAPLGAD